MAAGLESWELVVLQEAAGMVSEPQAGRWSQAVCVGLPGVVAGPEEATFQGAPQG